MHKKSKRLLPTLSVLAAGCLWGSMGLFVRTLGAQGLPSMAIVCIRSLVTAALTALFCALFCRQRLRVRLRDLWCFAGTGLCSVLFFNFCYFHSMTVLPLSAAAVLLYTAPVFVTVLSAWLFKERITLRKVAAMVLALLGCVLVSGVLGALGGAAFGAEGVLAGLGAGFGYALYSIFSRFAINRGYHPLTVTVYTFVFASLGSLLLADAAPIGQAVQSGGVQAVLFWVFYAVVTTVLPYLLYTYGLFHIDNSTASVIASVEPVMATLLGLLVFAEVPSVAAAIGMVLVLAAVTVLAKGERG